MPSGEARCVHASICLVLYVPVIAVAQVCLVLSVPENGPDWQLTQIGLQGCEISRTLDRINQMKKSYQVNLVIMRSRARGIFLDPKVLKVIPQDKFVSYSRTQKISFGLAGHFCTEALEIANCVNT